MIRIPSSNTIDGITIGTGLASRPAKKAPLNEKSVGILGVCDIGRGSFRGHLYKRGHIIYFPLDIEPEETESVDMKLT